MFSASAILLASIIASHEAIPSSIDLAKQSARAPGDSNSAPALLEHIPKPGRIVREEKVSGLDVTIWTLSNGMRVILKPTTLHPDQVLLTGYSWGGHSILPKADRTAAQLANTMLRASGLGRFNRTTLGPAMAAHGVNTVGRGIQQDRETVSGAAATRGTSALLQAIHLIFTAPRLDTAEARATIMRGRNEFAMAAGQLSHHLRDSVQALLWQHHERSTTYTLEEIERTDVARTFTVLRDRFADASGFTIILTGSLSAEALRPDVERYLASLPALHRKEQWNDNGIRYPDTVVTMTFPFGTNPRSRRIVVFNSPASTTNQPQSLYLTALSGILNERLQARLRGQVTGTSGVSSTSHYSRYPVPRVLLSVEFESSPERIEDFTRTVFEEVEKLRRDGPSSEEVALIKHQAEEEINDIVETNDFWSDVIEKFAMSGRPWNAFISPLDEAKSMTRDSLHDYIKQYVSVKRYVQVTQVPQ